MNARPRTLLFTLAAVALAGCQDTPTADVSITAPPPPSLSVSPPASVGSGAMVMRFQGVEFILVFDEERQLLAAHMPSNVCVSGDPGLNPVEVMTVRTPSQVSSLLATVRADDAWVSVYHASSRTDAGILASINSAGFFQVDLGVLCPFLTGPNLIAEGQVRRITTASAASFHGRWVGRIEGLNGEEYHLTEVYQLNADVHDPNNPDTFFEPVVRIDLKPMR